MKLLVDASVAVKWLIEEDGSHHALRILEQATLAAPDLLLSECANTLWKAARRGVLSPDQAVEAAVSLSRLNVEWISAHPCTADATQLAISLNHPAYDCLYLAIAQRLGLPFVTADARLVTRVRDAGLTVSILTLAEAAQVIAP